MSFMALSLMVQYSGQSQFADCLKHNVRLFEDKRPVEANVLFAASESTMLPHQQCRPGVFLC